MLKYPPSRPTSAYPTSASDTIAPFSPRGRFFAKPAMISSMNVWFTSPATACHERQPRRGIRPSWFGKPPGLQAITVCNTDASSIGIIFSLASIMNDITNRLYSETAELMKSVPKEVGNQEPKQSPLQSSSGAQFLSLGGVSVS